MHYQFSSSLTAAPMPLSLALGSGAVWPCRPPAGGEDGRHGTDGGRAAGGGGRVLLSLIVPRLVIVTDGADRHPLGSQGQAETHTQDQEQMELTGTRWGRRVRLKHTQDQEQMELTGTHWGRRVSLKHTQG